MNAYTGREPDGRLSWDLALPFCSAFPADPSACFGLVLGRAATGSGAGAGARRNGADCRGVDATGVRVPVARAGDAEARGRSRMGAGARGAAGRGRALITVRPTAEGATRFVVRPSRPAKSPGANASTARLTARSAAAPIRLQVPLNFHPRYADNSLDAFIGTGAANLDVP